MSDYRIIVDDWPLFDLHLRTPRLLLRPPQDQDFAGLLEAIDAGIHDPGQMPFSHPWTDAPPAERRRNAVQHWWANRAEWRPEAWHLELAVFSEGRAIGIQELSGTDFPVLREVSTGSWLSVPYQGAGFGKEMRAAVLHLAFAGLGALVARSGAFADNPRSAAVSRALGYRENGRSRQSRRGQPAELIGFELTVDEWSARKHLLPPVTVTGLDRARELFAPLPQVALDIE